LENADSESFNSHFKDEFLNGELFGNLKEAKALVESHRLDYNHRRQFIGLYDAGGVCGVLFGFGSGTAFSFAKQDTEGGQPSNSMWYIKRGHAKNRSR
jgi:hypothetical protein